MNASLCIHAHLYQPPREDPWLGTILTEGSAAPMSNWNERILRESYAPLAWARRLDGQNRILELFNCYEWMSFNVGPTLVRWMRDHAPDVLRRMREGDEKSQDRLGHGNAMAQCYHHIIMPLASTRDKTLQTVWAIDDFRRQFGRDPRGMWLPECAVDIPTLEVLAAEDIRFVILAPRQAMAVESAEERIYVNEGTLDIRQPYRVDLPSGVFIDVVFYHGGLSQGIAFEGLLRDGERFWQRLSQETDAMQNSSGGIPLLCLATDGETYGHHFTFGEMALAHALAQGAARRDNIRITNIAAYLAANPPTRSAFLHEPSSWSCVHGVERWRSDCGCTDGGHGNWNQRWRAPLRDALNVMRGAVDSHFFSAGKQCFIEPESALRAYGQVLADPDCGDAYARRYFKGDAQAWDTAWKLLVMQEQAMAAFASCAWFFDDLARLEPVNAMTFALRALDLMRETGGPDLIEAVADILASARSNHLEAGTGKEIFLNEVLPRRDDPAVLCLIAWLLQSPDLFHDFRPRHSQVTLPEVSVELFPEEPEKAEPWTLHKGEAVIRLRHQTVGERYTWWMLPPSPRRLPGRPFVRMTDCVIHVRKNGSPENSETCKGVAELSRALCDYIFMENLEQWERLNRPELRAVAANAAAFTEPWTESQNDVPRPEYWVGFTPYLLLESMLDEQLTVRQRMQVEQMLKLHLGRKSVRLAKLLVTEALLDALDGRHESDSLPYGFGDIPDKDSLLAEWIRRVRIVMPDMDWWDLQNRIWEKGLGSYPSLAEEVGFVIKV